MTFDCFTIRDYDDRADNVLYPLADASSQSVALNEDDGDQVGRATASSIEPGTGSALDAEQRDELQTALDTGLPSDVTQGKWTQLADAMASGDLVTMFFGGTVTALQAGGSASRVDSYLEQNCAVPQ